MRITITDTDILDWLNEAGRFTPGWSVDLEPLVIPVSTGFSLNLHEAVYAIPMLAASIAAIIFTTAVRDPVSVVICLAIALIFSIFLKDANMKKTWQLQQANNEKIAEFEARNKQRNELITIHNHLNVILEVLKLRSVELSERKGASLKNDVATYILYREIVNLRRGFFNKVPAQYQEGIVSLMRLGINKELRRAFFILDGAKALSSS